MTTKTNKKYIEEIMEVVEDIQVEVGDFHSTMGVINVAEKGELAKFEAFLIKTIDAVREERKRDIDNFLDLYSEVEKVSVKEIGLLVDFVGKYKEMKEYLKSLKSPITDREEGEK